MVILKFLFVFIQLTYAQNLKVETKLSAKQVEIGDRVILSIDVISNEKQIQIDNKTQNPRVEGLEFLNRSVSSSTSMSYVNGTSSVSYTQTLNFFFTPGRLGRIRIPKIPVIVDGQIVYSKPVVLQVVKEIKRKKKRHSNNPFSGMDSIIDQFFGTNRSRRSTPGKVEFFVDVEIENKNPYEGEQFVASWYIYTNGGLSQFDTLKFPTLKGFWKEDVEFAQNFRWERVEKNGKRMRRALMSSYALTPYKSGKFVIDSFDLRATVSSTQFGFGRPKVFKVKSKSYDIDVKPLPEPRPDMFSGGVGSFSIELDSFPNQANVGEPFSVIVRIKGNESNVKFLEDLKLDLSEDFELYETKEDIKFFPNQTSYIKRINYLVLPKKEGRFAIPDLKMVFFDTAMEEYQSAYVQFPLISIGDESSIGLIEDLAMEKVEKEKKKIEIKKLENFPIVARLVSPSFMLMTLPILVFLVLAFILSSVVLLKKPDLRTFMETLDEESQELEKLMKDKKYKKALEKMINLVSYGVGALSGRKYGVEQRLEHSLSQFPVSLESRKEEVVSLNSSLQSVRFGRFGLQDQAQVEECYSKFLKFKDMVVSYLDKD